MKKKGSFNTSSSGTPQSGSRFSNTPDGSQSPNSNASEQSPQTLNKPAKKSRFAGLSKHETSEAENDASQNKDTEGDKCTLSIMDKIKKGGKLTLKTRALPNSKVTPDASKLRALLNESDSSRGSETKIQTPVENDSSLHLSERSESLVKQDSSTAKRDEIEEKSPADATSGPAEKVRKLQFVEGVKDKALKPDLSSLVKYSPMSQSLGLSKKDKLLKRVGGVEIRGLNDEKSDMKNSPAHQEPPYFKSILGKPSAQKEEKANTPTYKSHDFDQGSPLGSCFRKMVSEKPKPTIQNEQAKLLANLEVEFAETRIFMTPKLTSNPKKSLRHQVSHVPAPQENSFTARKEAFRKIQGIKPLTTMKTFMGLDDLITKKESPEQKKESPKQKSPMKRKQSTDPDSSDKSK